MKSVARIAILYDSLAIKGGAGNVTVWLASHLAERGFDVSVFTLSFDPGLWPDCLLKDFSIHPLPNYSRNAILKRSNSVRRHLLGRHLSKVLDEFDIVVCNNNPSIQWVQIARKANNNIGRVIWLCQEPTRHLFAEVTDRHLLEYERYGNGNGYNKHIAKAVEKHFSSKRRKSRRRNRNVRWELEAVSAASVVVANSCFSAENIERVFSCKAEVIYPGVFPLEAGESFAGRWERPGFIGVVGRLSVKKNIENVIEAFRILVHRGLAGDIRLKVVGEGPEQSKLEQKVRTYGLTDRVSFLGRLDDADLANFYSAARLIVYLPIDEPFGLVPLEALFYGAPVVVPDHGGPAEVLTHGENAYMVNPFNPQQIAEGIYHCLTNEEAAKRMAAKGQILVKTRFTFNRFADRMQELVFTLSGQH